eukprot:scaffold5843_cov125-Isochrysis_galbana.AAC.4
MGAVVVRDGIPLPAVLADSFLASPACCALCVGRRGGASGLCGARWPMESWGWPLAVGRAYGFRGKTKSTANQRRSSATVLHLCVHSLQIPVGSERDTGHIMWHVRHAACGMRMRRNLARSKQEAAGRSPAEGMRMRGEHTLLLCAYAMIDSYSSRATFMVGSCSSSSCLRRRAMKGRRQREG